MARDLCFTSGVELAAMVRGKEISPVEIVDSLLLQMDRFEPAVNSFITVLAEEARADAKRAEQEVMDRPIEELGRLHGVPIAVKDLTPTAGVRTTYGVKEEAENVPEEDGVAWSRLKAEGPILLGKTATPPLGGLVVTESELNGLTNNPWDLSRTVGGSSGGSAAAVAAGFVPLATGSDGGASIRLPAGYCGAVGLKASVGRIPILPESSRFDTGLAVGPITRTVRDCALMTSIMAGPDPREPFSLMEREDYLEPLADASVAGMRIAMCWEGFGPVEEEVIVGMKSAAARFEELGATVDVVTMQMPDLIQYFIDYWCAIMAATDGTSGYDLSAYPPLAEWLELGSKVPISDFFDAFLNRREQIHEEFRKLFVDHDLVVTPSAPRVAFEHSDPKIGGPEYCAGEKLRIPAIDHGRFCDPATQANLPALVLLGDFNPEGLPIGMQLIAPQNQDRRVLEVGAAYEASAGLLDRRPNPTPQR